MTARKSFVLAHDLDGLHSEHTLPLTKAHVSSVGAVVGPTSAPFSAAVRYFLRHPPSSPPHTPWQQDAGSLGPSCGFL